mmetsp:Transcript_54193/g.60534  ORF Transcript_54193/g.60534 Transcript_54193/m.60534 type:complete len:115 (+) Transcript_54193:183-527(+)
MKTTSSSSFLLFSFLFAVIVTLTSVCAREHRVGRENRDQNRDHDGLRRTSRTPSVNDAPSFGTSELSLTLRGRRQREKRARVLEAEAEAEANYKCSYQDRDTGRDREYKRCLRR